MQGTIALESRCLLVGHVLSLYEHSPCEQQLSRASTFTILLNLALSRFIHHFHSHRLNRLCLRAVPPGRAIVIGLGIGFSIPMLGISWVQEKYTRFSLQGNEPGLIASAIVSAWTWLLRYSNRSLRITLWPLRSLCVGSRCYGARRMFARAATRVPAHMGTHTSSLGTLPLIFLCVPSMLKATLQLTTRLRIYRSGPPSGWHGQMLTVMCRPTYHVPDAFLRPVCPILLSQD